MQTASQCRSAASYRQDPASDLIWLTV